MNCDELQPGGFCEIIKKHVPKSYCAVCLEYSGDGMLLPKRIQRPQKRPCNKKDFENDYEKAKGMYEGVTSFGGQDYTVISKEQYIARRIRCFECSEKQTCPMRGCSRWQKLVLAVARCPSDKGPRW